VSDTEIIQERFVRF